jgi:MFS family permease
VFTIFNVFLIVPLFLSDEFGLSDTEAGAVFGALGGAISVYMMLVGTFLDKLGIKHSLVIGIIFSFLGITIVTFSYNLPLLLIGLLGILPLGMALVLPAAKISPRRYVLEHLR